MVPPVRMSSIPQVCSASITLSNGILSGNGIRRWAGAGAALSTPARLRERMRMGTVTNRLMTRPPPIETKVTLDLRPDRLRLEVVDRSVFDPTPETRRERDDVQFGLAILDRIADGWGRIDPPEGGIWAEFRVPNEA